MNKQQAKLKIAELVEKYERVLNSGKTKSYTEEETKNGFISPLFKALGWDIEDKAEVTAEETQSKGRVDYGFYLNGRVKFYLEAKRLKADLNNEEYAKQAVRYSWNKSATWAVLTDFESTKLFNAQNIEDSLFNKLFFEIKCEDFISRFDELWLLSKEAFEQNLLDIEAEKRGKKLPKLSVGEKLFQALNESRKLLIDRLRQWNDIKDPDLLDEGVQKLIDRLIFIRVAEDRGIEPPTLRQLIRDWENRKDKNIELYESMVAKFRELNDIYNSNLFQPHPFETWKEHSGKTEEVIDKLYGRAGYYEFDFSVIPADVLGSVYENYLGYRLAQSEKGTSLSKDARKRKEQGIYYTPTFVVDYIVKNALKSVLDKCTSVEELKKIKVLDPACGSGSFLTKALELINKKYKEFGYKGDELTKVMILQENIYGVDLDEQAVEIARLNLLINSLDKKMKLPALDKNIKNGNSLISGSDQELEQYFDKNYRDKKPFNWEEEFPEVFKQGGFDVIIGNPPYGAELDEYDKKYFYDFTKLSEYQLDTYILFIEKAFELLKTSGTLGFIIPNTWLTNIKVRKLRSFLVESTTIEHIINYSNKVFPMATVDNVTLVVKKTLPNEKSIISIILVNPENTKSFNIAQSNWRNSSVFNIFTDELSDKLLKKINEGTKPLEQYCHITVGIKPYQEGKGSPAQTKAIVEGRIYDSNIKIDDSYRLYLRGKDINKYQMNINPHQWISYGKWLAEPRKEEFFDDKEKLVIRQTGDSLIATIDTEGLLCLNNMHTINSKDKTVVLKYILGLLNSKTLNYYFQYLNPEKGEALAEVKATNVKRLPIKVIKPINIKIYKRIIDLVQNILSLNKQIKNIEEDSNKWNNLNSEIEKTDRKINEEVYKLYNLTPGEIKIVEGND